MKSINGLVKAKVTHIKTIKLKKNIFKKLTLEIDADADGANFIKCCR